MSILVEDSRATRPYSRWAIGLALIRRGLRVWVGLESCATIRGARLTTGTLTRTR